MKLKMQRQDYSAFDCGGPDVCSGCCSWRHGVYEDGSGEPEALAVMARCRSRAARKLRRQPQVRA